MLGGAWLAVDPRARRAALPGGLASSGEGLARFGVTVGNAALTLADYKWTLLGTSKEERPDEYKAALREANQRAARRLLAVCLSHGGIYTKFGQSIGNLSYALPAEFTETLAPLQDRAQAMPRELVASTVEAELGGAPLSSVFSEFDLEPVAAASLAQVHRAVLRGSGETVAVKLQYPYLGAQTEGDLSTLRLLAETVGYWFPDFGYSWLVPEFENNMALELDFVQEARNAERLARQFRARHDVLVPAIRWEHTTPRMLIMQFIAGIKVNDVARLEAAGVNPLAVARTVSSVFGDMIHVHGFVHCDPHAGNLMVLPASSASASAYASAARWLAGLGYAALAALALAGSGGLLAPGSGAALGAAAGSVGLVGLSGALALAAPLPQQQPYKLVVLDHGMYRRLDPPFRHAYCQLWRAMLLRDEALGLDAVRQLGVPAKHYQAISLIFAFRTPVSQQQTGARMETAERDKLRVQYKDVTAGDVNVFLQGLPRDLLFVLRSTNIVRSINLSLGGTTRLRFKVMGESAVRGMLVRNPSPEQIERAIQPGLPIDGARVINKPVASELVDAETVTWRQAFEMWRLRTFLELVDRSWGVLASLVKLL